VISPRQIKTLGMARSWAKKNLPGYDDEQYRLVLRNLGGLHGQDHPSGKDLDQCGFEQVMAWFESAGFSRYHTSESHARTYWNRKAARESSGQISDREIRMIEKLAADCDPDAAEALIAGMCYRMTRHRTDDLRQLRRREAYNLIEAFKAIHERCEPPGGN